MPVADMVCQQVIRYGEGSCVISSVERELSDLGIVEWMLSPPEVTMAIMCQPECTL